MPARLWVPAPAAAAVIVFAVVALVLHVRIALTGVYLNYLGGIWLALARDLSTGVFYRDLIGPLGYGGTRYFPLFFVVIGTLMKLGLSPLTAGSSASLLSAAVQAAGLARIGRALGVPRWMVWLLGVAALAPYFVQQTLFELRADVLAAGLGLLGIAAIIPIWRDSSGTRVRGTAAAAWLTLAVATKVTSLAIPISLIVGMIVSGRAGAAWRFAIRFAIGLVLFFAIVQVASGGRALESWRACLFAGTTAGSGLTALLAGEFIQTVRFSHLLVALFLLDVAALVAMAVLDWRSVRLPLALFIGVTGATAFTLSTPGAVPSNQAIDWIGVSLAVIAWTAASRRELTRIVSVAIAVLVVWMGAQDVVRVRALQGAADDPARAGVRAQVVDLVTGAPAPVLAESPLWPVLAGRPAYLLDPFALRVVTMARPDVAQDLEAKLDAHYFSGIILDVDPRTERGRGWYEHVHFGWPVMSRILANYHLEGQLAPDVWVYRPNAAGGP